MTAIAGLWWFDDRPDAADSCSRMLAAQAIYGCDESGQWSDGSVALGRQLSRVLPEDSFDQQPLVGAEGRYVLVADVRLDNRDELSEKLQISNAKARTLSDPALLSAAIERWEESCLDHLLGDFAFAVWDNVYRRLMLARDHTGQRPLHYHYRDGFVAFASMPKGLHALPEIPRAADQERIAEFLLLFPEKGPRSFFRDVSRVEPGHVVFVKQQGVEARRHWHPPRNTIRFKHREDYIQAARSLLDQAVDCRLRGSSRVGAYLSGGLDSGGVAATAARLLAPSGGKVVGFTAVPRTGYDGRSPYNTFVDEGEHASAVVSLHTNMDHVCISPTASPIDNLDRDCFLVDRPIMNLCNIGWVHAISCSMQKRQLCVALVGDFGNHGFSHNGLELLSALFGNGQWLEWWREAHGLVARGGIRWRGVLGYTLGPWCPPPVWGWLNSILNPNYLAIPEYSGINPRRAAELLMSSRNCPADALAFQPTRDSFDQRFAGVLALDFGNAYKGILGGWGVDVRDPTSDVRLLNFCLSIPPEQFLHKGIQRYLARQVLADRMPKFVIEESRRGRQAADWHEKLTFARDRLVAQLALIEECSEAARLLDVPRLRDLVNNWPSAGWETERVTQTYRYALLRAISAGHFIRWAGGAGARAS